MTELASSEVSPCLHHLHYDFAQQRFEGVAAHVFATGARKSECSPKQCQGSSGHCFTLNDARRSGTMCVKNRGMQETCSSKQCQLCSGPRACASVWSEGPLMRMGF